jgi:predicted ATPase
MRIAFSGAHRVGKTTLLEEVSAALPDHEIVQEPYELLEDDGYAHADPPALQDFQAQLERSLSALEDSGRDVLFDRCPADVLAYLLVHPDADAFELKEWLQPAREALQSLDLVVFVPIERPDRIPLPEHEDPRYRRAVHDKLEQLLLDDAYDLGTEVLLVHGSLHSRCTQVLAHVTATRT